VVSPFFQVALERVLLAARRTVANQRRLGVKQAKRGEIKRGSYQPSFFLFIIITFPFGYLIEWKNDRNL
jgi:hypothetical protein